MILDTLKDVLSCPTLSDDQINQIRLPETCSGLGLLSATQMAPAAFIGSARQAISELSSREIFTTTLSGVFVNQELNPRLPWTTDLIQHWNQFALSIQDSQSSTLPTSWSSDTFMALQPKRLQHCLFQQVVKASQMNLLRNSQPLDKIRIRSCSGVGSAAFLRAPYNTPGLKFTNEEFKIALKLRIKAHLYLACPPRCLCGQNIDDFGSHFFKCRIGGEWEHRHNSLVQLFASIIKSANLTVQKEVPLINLGPLASCSNNPNGRMDLSVTSSDSTSFLADVTVTHPAPSNTDHLSESAYLPQYFAKYAEERKIRKYRAASEQIGTRFIHVAIETYGTMGQQGSKMLKELAGRYHQQYRNSNLNLESRANLIRIWRIKISACLQRANARLIISKSNRVKTNLRQGSETIPPEPIVMDKWTIA